MKIEKKFLQSKVARRILTLFIFCALVPILTLAVVSFTRVSSELKKQNERQLHQSGKALAECAPSLPVQLRNNYNYMSKKEFVNENPTIILVFLWPLSE